MKNTILPLFLLLLFSCSKNEQKVELNNSLENTPATSQTEVTGKSLIEGADCLSCHSTANKMVGPSYREIAAKYENTPENMQMLADKIINGGVGQWGNIPMNAHPNLSEEHALKMVEYILTQKN